LCATVAQEELLRPNDFYEQGFCGQVLYLSFGALFMNKELMTLSYLYGQMTSSVLAIVFIWGYDSFQLEIEFFGSHKIDSLLIKGGLSFFILTVGGVFMLKTWYHLNRIKKNEDQDNP
jgi:hypothetical protein